MTIEQYLIGKVDFNLGSNTIAAILFDRSIAEGTNVNSVPERQRELATADVYMFLATSSTSSSSEYESDGGWQSHKSNKNVYDRSAFLAKAKEIYDKWDETMPTAASKVTMKPLY